MGSEVRESGAPPEADFEAWTVRLGRGPHVNLGAGRPGPGLPPATDLAQARRAIDRPGLRKEDRRGSLAGEDAARPGELLAVLRLRCIEARGRA